MYAISPFGKANEEHSLHRLKEEYLMARIGVEQSLSNVKEALTSMGHEVIDLRTESDAEKCEFAVISGQDKDMMGIANIITAGSVINAQGATTDEICQMVNEKVY